MNLTKEGFEKLSAANRYDLIMIQYINESGYAGCLPNGNIVDRRIYPEAIPVQENSLFGVVQPKPVAGDPVEVVETKSRFQQRLDNYLGELKQQSKTKLPVKSDSEFKDALRAAYVHGSIETENHLNDCPKIDFPINKKATEYINKVTKS